MTGKTLIDPAAAVATGTLSFNGTRFVFEKDVPDDSDAPNAPRPRSPETQTPYLLVLHVNTHPSWAGLYAQGFADIAANEFDFPAETCRLHVYRSHPQALNLLQGKLEEGAFLLLADTAATPELAKFDAVVPASAFSSASGSTAPDSATPGRYSGPISEATRFPVYAHLLSTSTTVMSFMDGLRRTGCPQFAGAWELAKRMRTEPAILHDVAKAMTLGMLPAEDLHALSVLADESFYEVSESGHDMLSVLAKADALKADFEESPYGLLASKLRSAVAVWDVFLPQVAESDIPEPAAAAGNEPDRLPESFASDVAALADECGAASALDAVMNHGIPISDMVSEAQMKSARLSRIADIDEATRDLFMGIHIPID